MASTGARWLRDRIAVEPGAPSGLEDRLPNGVGWLNTFGSLIIALLAFQAVTGMFLALYYSPHPDAAYESTLFIDRLPFGHLVHGMHRYADSALMVILGLHLLRVFIQGAYKAPREMVWLTGIVLLALVAGFGFTGYLLPWDQNAYFATEARTKYLADLPVVGPLAGLLLRGSTEVGALTLTRFYAIHILLLPALFILFVGAHALLVWRKGPTPPGTAVGEAAPATGPLVGQQLVRNAIAILAVFGIITLLAAVKPVELEFKANPADPTYHPRAEWYFLFLFQFVTDFGKIPGIGTQSWIPAVVIPGFVMTLLALLPWIDRSRERTPRRRPGVIVALVVVLAAVGGLTVQAVATLHPNASPKHSLYARYTDGGEKPLSMEQVTAGAEVFGKTCAMVCHSAYQDYTTGRMGPDLSGYGLMNFPLSPVAGHPKVHDLPYWERFEGYVRGTIRPPETKMPKYSVETLSAEQLEALGAYLSQDPAKAAPSRHEATGAQ